MRVRRRWRLWLYRTATTFSWDCRAKRLLERLHNLVPRHPFEPSGCVADYGVKQASQEAGRGPVLCLFDRALFPTFRPLGLHSFNHSGVGTGRVDRSFRLFQFPPAVSMALAFLALATFLPLIIGVLWHNVSKSCVYSRQQQIKRAEECNSVGETTDGSPPHHGAGGGGGGGDGGGVRVCTRESSKIIKLNSVTYVLYQFPRVLHAKSSI